LPEACWFSFAGVSAANEKINSLCVLCASAVNILLMNRNITNSPLNTYNKTNGLKR